MIKKIILLVLVVSLLASCGKTETPKVEETKKDVVEEITNSIDESSDIPSEEHTKNEDSNEKDMEEEMVDNNTIEEKEEETKENETIEVKTYSQEKVASYSASVKCRTIVDSKVYDITDFFGKHPGWDDALLSICWKDWTEMFNSQHMGSDEAKAQLKSMYKWELEK